MRISTLLFCLLLSLTSFGQKAVSSEIADMLAGGADIQQVSLVSFLTNDLNDRSFETEGLTKGALLKLNDEAIEKLISGNETFIRLTLPMTERENLQLDLVQHQLFSEDFVLYGSDAPGTPVNYQHGLHYRGIVSGDPNSIVALSVFNNEIMGMIATDHGNIILGRLEADRENRHILYNDRDLKDTYNFECGMIDNGVGYTTEELQPQGSGRDDGDCVRVYIEIDDDIVTQKGGAEPATNYITGLFNQSIVLYNAESINMMVSEIYAWTTPSPYNGSSSGAMLNAFQDYTGEFNGNVGHLVSYKASGGIAVLDNLCSSNPDWRKCFSSIDASYQDVPTYSWSVMVITHEMGHVVGSKHTHACAWNGDNTAIDGCAGGTEGNCPVPGNPPEGGTIMSYCHLTNVGINFNLGFGPQPGNVIRNRVNAPNNCLTSCGPPPPPPPPSYCASTGNNTSYEYIQKVVVGSINNNSGNNGGYGDFTSMSTDVSPGTGYTINLTPGFPGSAYTEYWRVWIDYNGDLDWNDAGEQVAQGISSSALNLSFTVPSNATSGTTRMRVSMKYDSYPTPCGSFTYGEVEDYHVLISGGGPTCSDGIQNQGEEGVDCGGPCPACETCDDGIQNQGEEGIDCGGPCAPCITCFDGIQNQGEEGIDCGGPCPACGTCNDGIQNQGEEGIDCGGPCAPCETCNDGIQNQGEEGVDCGGPCPACATCNDGIQNQGEEGIDCGGPCSPCPPPPPYCASSGNNTNYEYIQKVVLGSINNNSGNNGGYGDFTSMTTNLSAGTSYTINLTPGFAGAAYTEYWRVWIDYNGDNDWDDSGEVVAQGISSSALNLSFTVPSDAVSGTTRMRVSMKYGGYPSSCGSFTYGEVEDYNVVVSGNAPSCSDGIQNQGEEGIDCGGPCAPCPPPPPEDDVLLVASYFETGWDGWNDGGADAARVSTSYSWEGDYSIQLRDNSGKSSSMTSPWLSLSDATSVQMEFYFKSVGLESGEDFLILYKDDANVWNVIDQITMGVDFNNNVFYVATLSIPNLEPTVQGKLRIQCDASDDSDNIYIDAVTITKTIGAPLIEAGLTIKQAVDLPEPEQNQLASGVNEEITVYPNPANDILNIAYGGNIKAIRLMSMHGVETSISHEAIAQKQLDIHQLMPGMYFLWIQTEDDWQSVRFNKL